jgi:hypothetical protein
MRTWVVGDPRMPLDDGAPVVTSAGMGRLLIHQSSRSA